MAGIASGNRGLHELLCLGGWRAMVLDGEDRVRRLLGLASDPQLVGRSLDEALGEEAEAARAALAELEAVGRVGPRPTGLSRRQIAAFHHRQGRVVALRATPEVERGEDWSLALSNTAEALGGAGSSAEVVEALIDCVQQYFEGAVAVLCMDLDSGALICQGSQGFSPAARAALRTVGYSPSVLWTALRSSTPLYSVEVSLDPRFDLTAVDRALRACYGRDPGGACAVLPLMAVSQPLGCMVVRWPRPGLPGAAGTVALQQLARIAGVALDRGRATDALVGERQVLAEVMDSISDGVLGVTEDSEVLVYNRRLEELVGWTREDVTREGWLRLVYPDEQVRAEIKSNLVALTHGLPSEGRLRSLTCKDGRIRELEVRSRRVALPGGRALLMGFFRDLAVEQDDRCREMREENLQRLGRLAGGIAHGFNNILGAVMGHADLLACAPGLGDDARAHLGVITESARRGGQLANQLLVFGKSATLQTSAVSMTGELERLVLGFRDWLPGAITLRYAAEDGVPPAEVDMGQVRQAALNLLQNARESLGDGPGEIQVVLGLRPRPEAPAFCSCEAPPAGTPMVCVEVRDSGPGLCASALAHLFEPFFTTRARGHGLGLAAVAGIADAHGGAVELGDGPGATFRLYLPVSQRPELNLDALLADQPGRKRLVWAVDDESFLLDFVQVLLVSRGYQVETFSHPRDALARAATPERAAPDLLLLDVVMPVMQGPELLAALRERGLRCPALFVSGYPREALGLDEVAAASFLQKPYTSRDLLAAVAALLGEPAEPRPGGI